MVDMTRMTDRSCEVVRIAGRVARRREMAEVQPEHVLYALVLEGAGVAAHVLKYLGADKDAMRCLLPPANPTVTDSPEAIPWNDVALQTVVRAMDEARRLQHNYIGTEHLLMGIVLSGDGRVQEILSKLNLSIEVVCNEVYNLLGHGDYPKPA